MTMTKINTASTRILHTPDTVLPPGGRNQTTQIRTGRLHVLGLSGRLRYSTTPNISANIGEAGKSDREEAPLYKNCLSNRRWRSDTREISEEGIEALYSKKPAIPPVEYLQ